MAWYSEKHTDRLTLKIGTYTSFKQSRYAPSSNCRLLLDLYVNLTYQLKPGYLTGVLRLRAVREVTPIDPTGYVDICVTRQDFKFSTAELAKTSPAQTWLYTHQWQGAGTKGVAMHWELRPGKEFASAFVTTRYAKADIL